MEIYTKYNATSVLDFCAGWGGALIAACVLDIPKYTGIELNGSLIEPYKKLQAYTKSKNTKTSIDMIFKSALDVDYSSINYDLVFTSPPYYFIQKYENNIAYKSKKEMDELFYVNQILRILAHHSVRQDFIQTLMAHQSSDDLRFFFIFLF